ncbi:MAG TPA: TrmO family methyltransferase, partial [bacterium]|nr:TrmO family methyltransferase [bacterium]
MEQYALKPIGIIRGQDRPVCIIKKEYVPALKFIDNFSHILLITNKANQNYGTKLNTIHNPFNNDKFYFSISRIADVDYKAGIIRIDNFKSENNAEIFDIKPYFPIEDRIKNITMPDSVKSLGEWRIDRDISNLAAESNYNDAPQNFFSEKQYKINTIGFIRNINRKTIIQLENGATKNELDKLAEFSHLRVFWWFSRFDEDKYRKAVLCNPPYEKAPATGIFASRSPVRPNPIALTNARIINIDFKNSAIEISNIDAFDKTPVIDLKPYIAGVDRVQKFAVPEWLNHWPEWNEEEKIKEIKTGDLKNSDYDELKKICAGDSNSVKIPVYNQEFKFSENNSNESADTQKIIISGCSHHNLKNISLSIPKNKFTVVTGVSGSGKSSLVFDTVFAESQRRFMDSLSTTGRQAFEQFEKPQVDKIYGLPPAISVEQKSANRNPRSTVGTMTEIYDYLRLLFSRAGIRHCPDCGASVKPRSEYQIVELILSLPEFSKLEITEAESGELISEFEISPDKKNPVFKNKIKEIVKRALIIGRGAFAVKINDSISNAGINDKKDSAAGLGAGKNPTNENFSNVEKKFILHTRNKCYHCGRIFFDLSSSYFSYNNPVGMCPKCSGLGYTIEVYPELIVSRPDLSILDGASLWWGNLRQQIKKPTGNWWKGEVLALAQIMKVDLEKPWKDLPEDFKNKALYGTDGIEVKFEYSSARGRKGEITRPVTGAANNISRMFRDTQGEGSRQFYMQFMRNELCSECKGERLNSESRIVTVCGIRYPQAAQKNIEDLFNWINELPKTLE